MNIAKKILVDKAVFESCASDADERWSDDPVSEWPAYLKKAYKILGWELPEDE